MKACLVLLLAVAANAQFYNGFYNYPTAGVYNNYHHTPYAYKPVTYYKPMQYKTYSNDAVKPESYAAKGQYVAETAGSLHVAKREAEADPTTTLGYNTYQTGPLSYVKQPIVAYNQAFPYTAATGVYNNFGYKTAFPYHNMHSYGKREAEAEPEAEAEADPQMFYNTYQTGPLSYAKKPIVAYNQAFPYTAAAGVYNNFGYKTAFPYHNIHSYGKREAEAEPEAEADPQMFYNTYQTGPLSYVKKPIVAYNQAFPYTAAVGAYNNFGYKTAFPYHNIHSYGKREAEAEPEAEAEADPQIFYNTYQTGPLSYVKKPIVAYNQAFPYTAAVGAYNNFGYKTAFPYHNIHSYGKREAEAEPEAEAEADPQMFYNTYQTGPLSYVKKPIVAYNQAFPYTAAVGAYNNFGYKTAFPYHNIHSYGKREAEAEPQFYGSYYGTGAYTYGGYGGIHTTPYTYSSLNYPSRFYY